LYALLVVPSGIQMHQDFPGQGYRIERIYRGDPIYVFSLLRYY